MTAIMVDASTHIQIRIHIQKSTQTNYGNQKNNLKKQNIFFFSNGRGCILCLHHQRYSTHTNKKLEKHFVFYAEKLNRVLIAKDKFKQRKTKCNNKKTSRTNEYELNKLLLMYYRKHIPANNLISYLKKKWIANVIAMSVCKYEIKTKVCLQTTQLQ